ncbi:unnamed protein product [Calicophoron daubneyi]|uniref:G-protein coupled receptors family 1 profile domain-containing protein n=1 Tax=Calicophoron daubneyi TaxID=300641 RepID=A0AAV2TY80_CALDB
MASNFTVVNPCENVRITSAIPSHPVLILSLVGFPIVTLFGTIGNVISICILNPFGTRVSGHIYLSCLAVFDTMSLLFYMISFWNIQILKVYLKEINAYGAIGLLERLVSCSEICSIRIYLTFTFRLLSVWTVVILTMERFLLILFPLRFYKFLRPKVAWIIMGITTLVICLSNIPWFFVFDFVERPNCAPGAEPGSKYLFCRGNKNFYNARMVEFVFLTVIPCILLLVANMRIAITLADRRKFWIQPSEHSVTGNEVELNGEESLAIKESQALAGHLEAQRKERMLTMRLFLVSVVFCCLSLPSMVFVSIQTFADKAGSKIYLRGPLADGFHISLLLFAVNLAVNFIIYCCVGHVFRRAFWALCTCRYALFHRLRTALYTDTTEVSDLDDGSNVNLTGVNARKRRSTGAEKKLRTQPLLRKND